MGEVSAGSQMGKIRNFEKGFMATHLIGLYVILRSYNSGDSIIYPEYCSLSVKQVVEKSLPFPAPCFENSKVIAYFI